MLYLLDTHICIYTIKNKPKSVIHAFETKMPGEVAISAITQAELEFGVANSAHVEKNHKALQNFLLSLVIIPFDDMAAHHYGRIRAELKKSGSLIGPLDLLIAAHASSLGATLVTNNTAEFSRVNHLRVENWAK